MRKTVIKIYGFFGLAQLSCYHLPLQQHLYCIVVLLLFNWSCFNVGGDSKTNRSAHRSN